MPTSSSSLPVPLSPATASADDGRFEFGANWQRFLKTVNDDRIAQARQSLEEMFGPGFLKDKSFLDIGSGSGLFSLAAFQLGARVVSFDYDDDSVACTRFLHERAQADDRWRVEQGSVLDEDYLQSLGQFDVVYSWGVLHHTGRMWQAIDLASRCVAPEGRLLIAIYNDQGAVSRIWTDIKRGYQSLPRWLRILYVIAVGGVWASSRLIRKCVLAVAELLLRPFRPQTSSPPKTARFQSQRRRGMHLWYDLVDWIGGYPFEVSRPEEILRFVRTRGFELIDLKTCGGDLGCNEFLFERRFRPDNATAELTR